MKSGDGFLLGYSITTDTSFEAARKLYAQILRLKEDQAPEDIPIVLVGNKIDLDDGSDSIWGNRCVSFTVRYPFFFLNIKKKRILYDIFGFCLLLNWLVCLNNQ